MTTFTCVLCEQMIADTSMSRADMNSEIWQHFCSVHMEDGTDPMRVFGALIRQED
jgi:hypothetical protein